MLRLSDLSGSLARNGPGRFCRWRTQLSVSLLKSEPSTAQLNLRIPCHPVRSTDGYFLGGRFSLELPYLTSYKRPQVWGLFSKWNSATLLKTHQTRFRGSLVNSEVISSLHSEFRSAHFDIKWWTWINFRGLFKPEKRPGYLDFHL